MTEADVEDFLFKVCNVSEADEMKKVTPADTIRAVLDFLRVQQSVEDLDALGAEIFG